MKWTMPSRTKRDSSYNLAKFKLWLEDQEIRPSYRGAVKSYRTMEGFGVNTYKWINSEGKAVYVKYHWKPLAGEDPDIATRDLYDTP